IAETIHSLAGEKGGLGSNRPFVRINCPAIPETLLESELFGYQKGAFTGAAMDFKGKLRLADGGTLFLDEIAEFPKAIQSKLLRLLEQKTFEPLGSTTTIKINARIICATNRDLKVQVEQGLFREDLFYRINTITIFIPPLRERREDILPLAEFFLNKYAGELGKTGVCLSESAKEALLAYNWPGNIRELRNVVERAVVLTGDNVIRSSDLPFLPNLEREAVRNCTDKLEDIEKKMLLTTLKRCSGNISAAAKELGISRNKLRYRIKKYELKTGLK
ncbi:MAG: sigma-54 dependent transcriptional regulator, partial [Candidatus Omnitrophota bacterium]